MQKLGFILIIYGSSSESLGCFCSPCEWNHSEQVEFLPVQVPFDKSLGFHLNKSFLVSFQHQFVCWKLLENKLIIQEVLISVSWECFALSTPKLAEKPFKSQSCQYTHRTCCPTLSIRRPVVTCLYKLAKFVAISARTFHDTACLGKIF